MLRGIELGLRLTDVVLMLRQRLRPAWPGIRTFLRYRHEIRQLWREVRAIRHLI